MAEIINATTPTIKFSFSTVNVATIVVANLYVKNLSGAVLIEKDLESASVGQKDLSWKLTQQESLLLPIGSEVSVVLDWRIADGTRGRSKVGRYIVAAPGKGEVI